MSDQDKPQGLVVSAASSDQLALNAGSSAFFDARGLTTSQIIPTTCMLSATHPQRRLMELENRFDLLLQTIAQATQNGLDVAYLHQAVCQQGQDFQRYVQEIKNGGGHQIEFVGEVPYYLR